jgi:hypothetical protein
MPRGLVLLVLCALVGGAACQRPKVTLDPVFELRSDGGMSQGCEQFADLACVNFIKFQIAEENSATPATQCMKVDKRLTTLCDLDEVGNGTEVFRQERGDKVQIKMWGLRVFPATSCEINPECAPKVLFYGATDWMPAGDAPGGLLPLRITGATDCGLKEEYRPRGDRDCYSVCDYTEPVCDMADGCVCALQDDAGVPARAGNWAAVDAGGD